MEKKEACALLIEMLIGVTIIESSMEIAWKIKNKTTIWSSNSTAGYLIKGKKRLTQKDISTPIFTAALFTIAKSLEQPECPPMCE